jgi:hypothetical protein
MVIQQTTNDKSLKFIFKREIVMPKVLYLYFVISVVFFLIDNHLKIRGIVYYL